MVVIDFFNDAGNRQGSFIFEQYKTNVPVSVLVAKLFSI